MSPCSCTWEVLCLGGLVPSADFLQGLTSVTKTTPPPNLDYDDIVEPILASIINGTSPDNEGYPQALVTPIVSQIVTLLNSVSSMYKFCIYPIVKTEIDKRESKKSDLSIIRIYNTRTYVIIEVKLSVHYSLTYDEKLMNDISQLFLEGLYRFETEGLAHSSILLVLTDSKVWHFFDVNFKTKPLNVRQYWKTFYTQESECQECVKLVTRNIIEFILQKNK